jgi:formate hydrogenlyase subunit 3/multisubunit Na+/H+ antiporter MnhD subunit
MIQAIPFLLMELFTGPILPITIVCIIAMVAAVYYRDRKPIVSLLVAVSFFCLFISTGLIPKLYPYIVYHFQELGYSNTQIKLAIHLLGLGLQIITITGIVLLLVAIYGWRQGNSSNR